MQNPLVKRVVALKDRKQREGEGVFVIEGEKEISFAVGQGISPEILVYCSGLLGGNDKLYSLDEVKRYLAEEKLENTRLVEVDQRVYARMAYRDKVEGLLAVAPISQRNIEELKISETPFLLIALGIEKPGNLGALLRTADGAGVDGVLLCGGGVDLYNPNVVRASLGAVFTVPAFEISLESALAWLEKRKVQIVLTSPEAPTDYTRMDYTGPVAIVLGSEKQGLPEILLQQDITQVTIPMYGKMDSLNVSCSGAVLLYEVLRQRRSKN